MQALCRAFGKLVTHFNDLGSRIDDIAADNLGARNENGNQAGADRGKPRQAQTQNARIHHRGGCVIGRHHVGARQCTAIGRHLGVSSARHAPYRRGRRKQQRKHHQNDDRRGERGIGTVFDKQVDTGTAHKAAPLAASAWSTAGRKPLRHPQQAAPNPMQQSMNHNLPPAIRDAIDTRRQP